MWQKISDNLNIIAHPVDSIHKSLETGWSTLMNSVGLCSFFAIMLSMLLWQMGWDEGAKKIGFPAMLIFILSGVYS